MVTTQYPISEEEHEAIRKNTITSSIKRVKAEPTLDQQIENKRKIKQQEKIEAAHALAWKQTEERKKRIEENDWKIHSQGRPVPEVFEVFFSEPEDCNTKGCEGKICVPLSGYNPWRSERGYQAGTKYNASDKTRHFCRSQNSNEYCDILSERITALEDALKLQGEQYKEELRRSFFVTATHGV